MTATSLKLGFIGLGIMGAPMAGHLLKAGHTLFVNTRSQVPADLLAAGATNCSSAQDVAKRADIIFLMLPDTPDVEKVLFSEGGVASGLSKGKTVVDCSSIDPIATKGFAAKIRALGCDYLDAPVSGGEVGAKAASLTIMVGAEQAAFDHIKPLFELMWVVWATARFARWRTRSLWPSILLRLARHWSSLPKPAQTRPGCARH